MHVVIRTDASLKIGTGHVMRCLTLAEQLRGNGSSVHFISRKHEGHLCDVIEIHGFPVHRLPVSKEERVIESELGHAGWLGVRWQDDARETSKIIEQLNVKPEWLVVDHYALDFRWERVQRPYVDRIFIIDDLADRVHDCDLLLDQNQVEKMSSRYAGLIPDFGSLLLGPSYAILQPIYTELHDSIPPREGKIGRILIFFGGVDSSNLTGLALQALIELQRPDIIIDVVVGQSCANKRAICEMAQGRQNINLHHRLPSLASLMVKADLAIGGGGTTTWERLCLGLPSLVITLADNQKPIAECLHRNGLLHWLGHNGEVTIELLRQALETIVEQNLEHDWSERCQRIVDGKGIHRVSTILLSHERIPLQVRRAKVKDEALLLEWANDPQTRQNGFSSAEISPEVHHRWFVTRLRDIEGCALFIVETQDGVPLGQVRFQREGEELYEVHYSLAKLFRGKKLGKKLLSTALQYFSSNKQCVTFVACVKKENIPSQKIFQQLGFVLQKESDQHESLKYLLHKS